MKTLVLGIGNKLLSDEGAGVHAISYLQNNYPNLPQTTYVDGGTLSFSLAAPIENVDNLIVIDAAQLNSDPGSVKTFIGPEMDDFIATQRNRSVHELGLLDLMLITRLTGKLPRNRALIGIQPDKLDWGESPTRAVEEAIPDACNYAVQLIGEWQT